MIELAASILSADFSQLGGQLREALSAGVQSVRVDVMDGQFVPNLSMGPEVLSAVRSTADAFGATVAAHLMIVQPERFVSMFIEAGADRVIIHVESARHPLSTLRRIRELGAKPAVAINPTTPLVMLEEVLTDVDLVLAMSVEPGFGKQAFLPTSLERVARIRRMLTKRNLESVGVAVDGGVHRGTIASVASAGANYAVVGSALFNSNASVSEKYERCAKRHNGRASRNGRDVTVQTPELAELCGNIIRFLSATGGVEASTGVLGQGVGNAPGLAIGEAHLAARDNRLGHESGRALT